VGADDQRLLADGLKLREQGIEERYIAKIG
jgi:hypothetical protein